MSDPLCLYETTIQPEWIDEFDHMNLSYYVLVCDHATYAFWEYVNGGSSLAQRGGAEYAIVETHVNYIREVRLGDPVKVSTQLLGCDEKRFRLFHTLYHAGEEFVSATNEVMGLGFDLHARRIRTFQAHVRDRLEALLAQHARLETPPNAGRAIGIPVRLPCPGE